MADLNEKLEEITKTEDTTASFDEKDIQDNKGITVLAYLSWLLLVPLLTRKDSKFVRFNCNQGLVLAIAETGLGIISSILGSIPWIGIIFSIICYIGQVFCVVLSVIGIVNVSQGKAKELPIVGKIKILK